MKRRDHPQHTALSAIREAAAALADMRRTLGGSSAGKCVLWVDDHPGNNDIPRRLLEDAGASVELALSTAEAISRLEGRAGRVDLVISDMGQGENSIAGIELLRFLHRAGMCLPVIIYSDSPKAQERRGEIENLGAVGPVLGPKNLIAAVSRLL